MGQLIIIAIRNLLQHRRRSLLLGGAMALVTVLLVLLGAVGAGIESTMMKAGTALLSGHVNVSGFYKVSSGRVSPLLLERQKLIEDVQELVPEALRISDRLRGFGKLVSERDSIQAAIIGVSIESEPGLQEVLRPTEGNLADLSLPHSLALYEAQAKRLGVNVGDAVTLSSPTVRGQYNSVDTTVRVIMKDLGILSAMSTFASPDTLRDLNLYNEDTTGSIYIYLEETEQSADVEARLRTGLTDKGYELMEHGTGPFWGKFQLAAGEDWTGQRLDLTTWEAELLAMQWVSKTFSTVSGLLIMVLLVIILVGVMNTLWIVIRDRTREIGTLRAIGMGKARILISLVIEVGVLSVAATLFGMGVGSGVAALINALQIQVSPGFQLFLMSDTLNLVVDPRVVLNAIMIVPAFAMVASLLPAWRATRLKPITAIHHVG